MTTGIVLAGGRSARFRGPGGESKLDIELEGRTLLDRTIDALATVCRDLVVVGPTDGPRDDVTYLGDPEPFEGPLAGIRRALVVEDDAVVVVGGDTPLVRPTLLAMLAGRLSDPACDAVVLADRDQWRPLPLALRVATAGPAIGSAFDRGERSIRRALAGLRLAVIGEAEWRAVDPEGDTLFDIDTAEDLELARRRLARPAQAAVSRPRTDPPSTARARGPAPGRGCHTSSRRPRG